MNYCLESKKQVQYRREVPPLFFLWSPYCMLQNWNLIEYAGFPLDTLRAVPAKRFPVSNELKVTAYNTWSNNEFLCPVLQDIEMTGPSKF